MNYIDQQLLDLQNSILETVLVLLGVLAENLIVIFFLSLFGREDGIRFWVDKRVGLQPVDVSSHPAPGILTNWLPYFALITSQAVGVVQG